MATFLAKRIVGRYLTFGQVPDVLKTDVSECLESMGRGDLATNEAEKEET